MDADFWLERWRQGRTNFHMERVTPLLQKYWPGLNLPVDSKVLVPLCGKTLDMVWLAEQGHRVLGVELSSLAIERFFQENALTPVITESALGTHYTAGKIEIICGDIFELGADILSSCSGAYDRAALVALPADMRKRYVEHVYGQLADNYRGLLLTLVYDQRQMDGPPFSVEEAEVQALYAHHTQVSTLDRRDILAKEPKFRERGLSALDTVVFQLSGRSDR
ncbi:thiopurine S-methyltransferase [Allopusillimonas ginsengisoli]|uniref:thiopurine S-methyltransferase n=1 Tax=Allopusillimonas ginsengisoli TaxID=453575 RepID=UPI0010205BBC|nr:thiopurine S-methyltransferase [Allopusillimonas ginsengisoli]TEA78255.1 thiopurine S-methyltransferase [Allopusillimonas ginsengisoli]